MEVRGIGKQTFLRAVFPDLKEATNSLIKSNEYLIKCLQLMEEHQDDFSGDVEQEIFHSVVLAYNSTRISQYKTHNVIMGFLRIADQQKWTLIK